MLIILLEDPIVEGQAIGAAAGFHVHDVFPVEGVACRVAVGGADDIACRAAVAAVGQFVDVPDAGRTGVAIGLFGIVLLNTGSSLGGNPWGAVLILIASISWAFGSVWSSRLTLPTGLMAGAAEMIVAGVVLLAASYLSGEKLAATPSLSGFLALGYLMVFGSMIAISAYMFLLKTVRPAIATSYAYVNPIVAVLIGISFGGEWLSPVEWVALVVILCAVLLVTLGKFVFGRKPAVIQEVKSNL